MINCGENIKQILLKDVSDADVSITKNTLKKCGKTFKMNLI